ncbi:hypothetical protein Ae201684P_007611 [Aphanomyces euteiches]|nr:hypothetical protein Ae201684P_007611 [Aphanomyces euteiches]
MAWSQTQTGNKVKVFRSDGGAEYSSADFEAELKRHGIHHESSTPDNQWQNGMAERAHRSLMEMAMAMLAHAGLARRWWAEAVNTAGFIQNRVVHGHKATATPIHALTGHRAKLDKLRVFGCVAYNMVKDPTRRDKLAPKATKCVFMGCAEHQRAWKLYDLESNKMTTGVHVTFCEDEFLGDRSKLDDYLVTTDDSDDEEDEGIITQSTSQPAPPIVEPTDSTPRYQETRDAIGAKGSAPSTPRRLFTGHPVGDQSSRRTLRLLDRLKRSDSGPRTHDDRNVMPSGMVLRPRDRLRPPSRDVSAVHGRPTDNPSRELQGVASEPLDNSADANWTIDDSHVAASMTIDGIQFACSAMAPPVYVPQSHREAMAMKDHDEWAKAEQKELQQLRQAATWKLVDLPPGRKSIGSRWTYAKKTNAAGEVVRYKARLVCKGFSQIHGVDYLDTFSPVVKMTTLRCCMALTATKKLAVLQADADTAFPTGHSNGTNRKMLMIKALYGLKQAALAWFEHCRKIVVGLGFRPSDYDPCLYLRQHGEELEMVESNVDDFLVFARTTAKANSILDELEVKMKLKRQGEMSFFLGGIKIEYDKNDAKITLTQEAYARKIFARFGMTTCHGYTTAEVDDREDLWHDSSQPSTDQETYQSMVVSLMYLMTCTRPDISHAVQRLTRHLHDPRHTIGTGLIFRSPDANLVGYCDASWATRLDRRSTTGFACFVSGGIVSWKSARQRVVALSTCEVEYVALAELAKEVVWLRGLLEDLSMRQDHPTITWCDNKAAISTAENVGVASRSKHIDVATPLHSPTDPSRRHRPAPRLNSSCHRQIQNCGNASGKQKWDEAVGRNQPIRRRLIPSQVPNGAKFAIRLQNQHRGVLRGNM